MEFDKKVALVSGAAGAIGKGLAARLIREGARVFITDLDQARLEPAMLIPQHGTPERPDPPAKHHHAVIVPARVHPEYE